MKLRNALSILILITLAACGDPEPTKVTIAPEDVNQFIKALVFEGAIEDGVPDPSTNPSDFTIKVPSGINVTYDNFTYLPLRIISDAGFDGIYIQLSNEFDEKADSYIKIPLQGEPGDSSLTLKLEIPPTVEPGLVFMNVSAYHGAQVTEVHSFPVQIVDPQVGCDAQSNSTTGDQQFGSRTYTFEKSSFPRDNFGQIIELQHLALKAELFEEPDRIDVYVDKLWVGGTGTSLAFGEAPPAADCDVEDVSAKGFVSGTRYIPISIRPDQRIDVLITGCLGSTAWEYTFNCPGF